MRQRPSEQIKIDKAKPWIDGNPFESNLFHAISILLPAYERAMVRFISDVKLAREHPLYPDILGFMTDEAIHSRLHKSYNDELQRAGYRIVLIQWLAEYFVTILRKFFPNSFNVAVAAAGEQITATIGLYCLKRQSYYEAKGQEDVRRIWLWHSVEEIDHRDATHRLAAEIVPGQLVRIAAMALIQLWLILPMLALGILALSWQDRSLLRGAFWTSAWSCLFGEGNLAPDVLSGCWKYMRADFDPACTNDRDKVRAYDEAQQQGSEANSILAKPA